MSPEQREQEVARMRAAGISDLIIEEVLAEEAAPPGAAPTPPSPPMAPAGRLSEAFREAEAQGIPVIGSEEPSWYQTGTEGAALAPYIGGGALAGGLGVYGLGKVATRIAAKRTELDRQRADTAKKNAETQRMAEERRLKKATGQPQPRAAGIRGPIVPAGGAVPAPITPAVPPASAPLTTGAMRSPAAASRPALAPTPAPAPAPAPTPAPATRTPRNGVWNSLVPPAAAEVRQSAMSRILPAAGRMAMRGMGALGLGAVTGVIDPMNAGQQYPFPQTGPMAGRELNPSTGAPWTPEELARYRRAFPE